MKSVCCVMLANGRPEMVRRAVASFKAQEYPEKWLLIWNTGGRNDFLELEDGDVAIVYSPQPGAIGQMRNRANMGAFDIFPDECDYFAHWDSDDWSHPLRLSEQVELCDRSRADVVGYKEVLFWDSSAFGAAWSYRSQHPTGVVGASLLYPRATWERKHFPTVNIGEDTVWLLNNRFKVHASPSTWSPRGLPNHEPRMICGIHGGNTSSKIVPTAAEWKREIAFDRYCEPRMTL